MKRLTALALSGFFFFVAETPARAQGTVRAFQIISAGPDSSIGLGRGQTLRYTWVNIGAGDLAQPDVEVLAVHVRVFSNSDRVVAQAGAPAVGPGKSQFFDFNRDEMSVPGESGTGRLQLRLEVSVEYASSLKIDQFEIRQRLLESFDDGAEVIDSLTGRSTVSFKPKEIVVVGSKPLPTAAAVQDSIWIDLGTPVGITLQQTLRITAFNPLPPAPAGEDARTFKMLVAPLIVDLDGEVIARGEAIALDPGQSHSFDFRRADLPSSGESGTGRLQVRSVIQRRFYNGLVSRFSAGGRMDRFPGALELVDEGPGTTAMLLPAIQAAREKAGR
jgi:hypothetical protein